MAIGCRIWDKRISFLVLLCSLPSTERLSMITISELWRGPGSPPGGQTWALSTRLRQPHLPQVRCKEEILTLAQSSELTFRLSQHVS